jgi:hypothetical protein
VPFIYRGIPLLYVAGAIGLIAAALRPGQLQRFHLAWSLSLLGFFFVIMLTANVRPRFRFVFEPLWFVYVGFLTESLWVTATHVFRRK